MDENVKKVFDTLAKYGGQDSANRLLYVRILMNEYEDLQNKYLEWRRQKPFGFVSKCQYAKKIVLAMIHTAEDIQKVDPSRLEEGLIESLYRELHLLPPPGGPSHAPPRGMVFIYFLNQRLLFSSQI